MRSFRLVAGVIAAAAMALAAVAYAQSESGEGEEAEAVEEIQVIARPEGRTALELEQWRLERMREAILEQLRLREREAEEVAWRQADPDLENPQSRIKWGYSPQAELRMRRENDFLQKLSTEQVQPASVIRITF